MTITVLGSISRPPAMSAVEQIRRFKLQLEGLQSWPVGPERTTMTAWVERQIAKLSN